MLDNPSSTYQLRNPRGLIYGLLSDDISYQKSINMAVASCCLKHTIYGDYNLVSLKDMKEIMNIFRILIEDIM